MANTAQLLRRQSSRDIPLRTQRSIDVLELRELRNRLVRTDTGTGSHPVYGALNQGFISDLSPESESHHSHHSHGHIPHGPKSPAVTIIEEEDIIPEDKPEEERESWDSKLTFLLATIGFTIAALNEYNSDVTDEVDGKPSCSRYESGDM
uniref:Uncharacterized protein n=1 Tax=Megaselia scalaris TaxID=36166 RepID=T1H3I3_MEGSC